MMIADLVDQTDVYQCFKELGIKVTDQQDVVLCCQQAADWYLQQDSEAQQQLADQISSWLGRRDLLLPDVSAALQDQLEILLQR